MPRPRKSRLVLPPHVHLVVSRGREYTAYHPFRGTKRAGARTALPGLPMLSNGEPNPEWWAAYRMASGREAPKPRAGTFRALCDAWSGNAATNGSPEWARLAANTQRNYRTALTRILAAWADLPVRGLEPRHVRELRDQMRETPEAANSLLTALSSMLGWSIPRGWRADNPCEHVKPFPPGEPWSAWSWDAIDAFRALAIPEMRCAMALALYTGQRRGDVLRMNWSDVDHGAVQVIQEKTGKRAWIPLHRDLRTELSDVDRHSTRILTGDRGKPLRLEGFKTTWQRQMECVELMTGACHGLVFHGLRKSSVCFLLEAGCSTEEVAAITRQSRAMIEHYAANLNRQRLASRTIAKWENET
jgi:integrase